MMSEIDEKLKDMPRQTLNKFIHIFDNEIANHAVSAYPKTKQDAILEAYGFAKDKAIQRIKELFGGRR